MFSVTFYSQYTPGFVTQNNPLSWLRPMILGRFNNELFYPSYACIFRFSLTVYNFYDFFKTPKLMEHLGKKSIPCHNVKKIGWLLKSIINCSNEATVTIVLYTYINIVEWVANRIYIDHCSMTLTQHHIVK